MALVRQVDVPSVEAWATGYLADDSISTGYATWEQLHGLAGTREGLSGLRDYMADKSVNLRRAFAP